MQAKSEMLRPPTRLASCISVGVFRDTRGTDFGEMDRLNYFPAAPLTTVTLVLHGLLHMSVGLRDLNTLKKVSPLPKISIHETKGEPVVSWSPGPVTALTIGFYPDAWNKLEESGYQDQLSAMLQNAFSDFDQTNNLQASWITFCANFGEPWEQLRGKSGLPKWIGTDRISDWTRHIIVRAATGGAGKSIRSVERRLKRWTRQSRQELEFYAQIEKLHHLSLAQTGSPLAEIALDAEFSDQSHMGRAVRRATGFSPADINKRIATEEAFWCYRLLGDRF